MSCGGEDGVDGLMAACYVFLGYSTFVDFLVFGEVVGGEFL